MALAISSSKSDSSSSSKMGGIKEATLASLGNLIKLLPTGTVFLFQFLNPVLTNNGHCHAANKYLSGILLGLCGFSCCFSCFTDSYTSTDGAIHYGIVTATGLWPKPTDSTNVSKYKLRLGDFAHALLSLMVFAVVSFLDPNTMHCFYPSLESTQKVLLMVLPPIIGAISGTVFVVFPNDRHWIGYPSSNSGSATSSTTKEGK